MMNQFLNILYLILFIGLCSYRVNGQPLCANNPSFEGTSQAHVVPSPWVNCGGSPDTQPGQWGITQPASNGNTYVSFLQSGGSSGGYYEGATQVLSNCMVSGQTYTISVDLAHSNTYNTAGPGNCYSSFAIYGGNGNCGTGELLGQVGPIMHTNWQTYTFTFTPTGNWCYITFRPIWLSSCSGYINILVDNLGCVTQISGVVATTDVTCNGVCDGTATATPNTGIAPFTYIWNNGGVTSSLTGLCPGTYIVTITDNAGDTASASETIVEPTILANTVTTIDVSCQGGSDGSAKANTSGGTPGYTYSWSTGDTVSLISNLSAGSYSVSVTDLNDCLVVSNFTILDGGLVIANISSSTGVSCFAGTDGSAIVVVTDGVPSYSYLWSNGQTSSSATNLSGGSQFVTVTDANGCTIVVSTTINEPSILTAGILSSANANCNGSCDGMATALANGGTQPYSYLWGNGQTVLTATGLCTGITTLDITDANGCLASTTITITEPAVLALNTTVINPNCVNSCDGSASVTTTGGTVPYTYLWNDPAAQSTVTASSLCDGSYVITLTDSNGCISVATATLTDPNLLVAAISNVTDIDCYGNCNGFAQVSVSGAGSPYTYAWNSGDTTNQATALCQGTYTVTVNNINGCESVTSATIIEPVALSASLSPTNVTCFNACDGIAVANPSGGIGPYTYLWDDGLLQTTQTASNLCSAPGGANYCVTITDSNGCSVVKCVLITQPTQLSLIQNTISPTTCSSDNGGACVNALGGIAPYTIVWNDSANTIDSCITGVYAGVYNPIVTDGMGCTFTMPIMVTDIAGPNIDTIAFSPLDCNGDNNGTANTVISGGTTPYTYTWFNGGGNIIATGSTFIFGLTADIYTIMIEDGNQCVSIDTFSITEPPILASAISSYTDATCSGICNGTAMVAVAGGTTPYSYGWTNGITTSSDSGMCAGIHNVLVTDANGCNNINSLVINEPAPLTIGINATDITCNGMNDGSICLTPSGGTVPYTYFWIQSGQTTNCISNLSFGTYDVNVTDNQGCIQSETIPITEPQLLSATATTMASKCGNYNGEATVNPIGGSSPYSYVWDPGGLQTSQTATGLLAGTYTVTITDAMNCSFILTNVNVNDIAGPIIDSVITIDADCNGNATGSGTVYISGGTNPISYLWSNGQTSLTGNGFSAGQISITVSDLNGCDTTAMAIVNEPVPLIASTDADPLICYGQDTIISASASGGVPPYTYNWNNSVSGSSQQVSPLFTTTYTVVVTDSNNCIDSETITVNVADPISPNLGNEIICDGDNVTLNINTSGGSGIYTYVWDPPISTTSSSNVSPSTTTTYDVTVSDGCSTPVTIQGTVTVNPTPIADFQADCFPDEFMLQFYDSSTIETPGEIAQWAWDFGNPASGLYNTSMTKNTSHVFTQHGIYTVNLTVTSDLGCTATISQTISSPPTASFSMDKTESSSLNPTINLVDMSLFTDPSVVRQWEFGDGIITESGYGDIVGITNTSGTYEELSHTYKDTGIFYITLTITEPNGCKDSIGKYFRITSEYVLYTPNTFSPNSYIKENNFFKPKIIGIGDDEFEFIIYNRWGDRIYRYNGNYHEWEGWDGKANSGKEGAQMDVYVWMIRTEDLNQEEHEYIGHITLLR